MSALHDESRSVLVADDDPDDFLTFEVVCEELSFKIVLSHVTNSDALLKALDEQLPDILFLDIMMPTLTGTHCLRMLRSNRRFDGLPIIMYTSMTDIENVEFCFREGANLYVIKPSSFQELKQTLERILTINWKKAMYFPTRDSFVIQAQLKP
ncbi:MAG TPA: response regulator [Chryseolinea sp.]|nr:response regulator [Chryseolinea sp.]